MAEYELTRRDAVAALAAVAGAGTGCLALTAEAPQADGNASREGDPDAGPGGGDPGADSRLSARDRRTVRALTRTLYTSEVANVGPFVSTYLDGLATGAPDRLGEMAAAVDQLDDHARAWHDAPFAALDAATRDRTLRSFGLESATPDPAGNRVERVRHYLVDELLLALYASPTGGDLVGLPNPPGHPGGLASYRRGPGGE